MILNTLFFEFHLGEWNYADNCCEIRIETFKIESIYCYQAHQQKGKKNLASAFEIDLNGERNENVYVEIVSSVGS